ncbi:MAG TPA: hypothetical protein VNL98_08225, partial [Gemmatimonadales bacterium]|nr:hypothetical protein [Gemmatimonadales bacterium]
ARRLQKIATAQGLGTARVGIADAAITAYAATYSRGARAPWHRGTIVPSGRDAEFLAPFSLTLLQLDEDLTDTFAALGLTKLGQLAALDADEVESRFGPAGLAAHRLARGIDSRGPSTPRDDDLPAIECDLGGPVETSEPILFVLKGALASLGSALRTRGLAARELTLELSLDDGSRAERVIRPARSSSHEGALLGHARAALEDWHLGSPVLALRLRATLTVPASGEQGDLLVPRWADPSALAAAFDRIRAKEGGDAVARPQQLDAHLAEDQAVWRDSGEAVSERNSPAAARARSSLSALPPYHLTASLRLLPEPAPIRVRLGRAGLEALRHGSAWHDVTAWAGPERLSPRWWQSDDDSRDYYTVRDRGGALWIVYRRVKRRDWFLEGWWD